MKRIIDWAGGIAFGLYTLSMTSPFVPAFWEWFGWWWRNDGRAF